MKPKRELFTTTKFRLCEDEIKRLCTSLALLYYKHEHKIEYNEQKIRCKLGDDLQRFNKELIRLQKEDPNNLTLFRLRLFIERLYAHTKAIVKEEAESNPQS